MTRWAAILLLTMACGRSRAERGAGEGEARTAAAPDARASVDDDCAAAVANMRRIAPDLVPGDEDDLATCRAMPRDVARCLRGVTTVAEADRCVREYAATHGGRP